MFTTGQDDTLKKWSTDPWSVVRSVELESEGRSLLITAESNSILLGTLFGFICEFSIDHLSLIRRVIAHYNLILKIIQLSSGDVLTCSLDGSVCLPFRDNTPIKVSDGSINSITELSDKTIACCCDDGLRIIPSPAKNPPLVEKAKVTSSTLDPISYTLDSLSSSIDSIRASTSDKKSQLVSLLQHH